MKATLIPIFSAIIICGCNSNVSTQKEIDQLKKELDDCKKSVSELKNTPEQRFTTAKKLVAQNDYSSAGIQFQEIIDKFPGTDEAKTAAIELRTIRDLEQKNKEAEEKKKTLGFKSLKENTKLKVGDVQLSFSNITTANQWVFDRYGDEWRYRSAERGNKYIVAKVSILADSKNPELPPINVYKLKGGQLTLVGTMGYEFVRWEDYGSYLGNTADYGNDFAHSSTIPFSCGLEISNKEIEDVATFVVVKKTNCFSRSENRFDNPPVSYKQNMCDIKETLTVNDFDKDYVAIKIFHKEKL